MIPDRYVWLVWSSAFLVPWFAAYIAFPRDRKAMLWASLVTMGGFVRHLAPELRTRRRVDTTRLARCGLGRLEHVDRVANEAACMRLLPHLVDSCDFASGLLFHWRAT